jgi:formylglycine-generating enzyme required for sulfatase activity/serine/threonine protein kinase
MNAFPCPTCGRSLKIKPDAVGKRARCPGCQQVVQVPNADAQGAPLADAATMLPLMAGRASPAHRSLEDLANPAPSPEEKPEEELLRLLSPPLDPGEIGRLGNYRVLKVLGAGGMGTVLQAEDLLLKRAVALKVMLPSLAASESHRQRFLREGQAVAAISHDHVVPIFQVGQEKGVPFLAMPLLQGESLDAAIKRKVLSVAVVLRIGRETAEGLAAAHAQGLIHRDIKPGNIWLETLPARASGEETATFRVKILDFGLVRSANNTNGLTQVGAILGTPGYMAPEQGRGEAVDARTDLFALGCVLYHLATGRPAFRGRDMIATLLAVATEHPPSPAEVRPGLQADFSALIMQMLEKDPERRPASAAAVAASLAAIERQDPAGVPVRKEQARAKSPDSWTRIGRSPLTSERTEASETSRMQTRLRPTRKLGGARSPKDWVLVAGGGVVGLVVLACIFVLLRPGAESKDVSTTSPSESITANQKEAKGEVKGTATRPPAGLNLNQGEGKVWAKEVETSIGMKFVRIPAGSFTMGSPKDEKDRQTGEDQHEVEITRAFYLGVHEVTQKQFKLVMGYNPSHFSTDGEGKAGVRYLESSKPAGGMAKVVGDTSNYPVENVSWDDAVEFCRKLTARERDKERALHVHRLPTEAEWEYACRRGASSTPFHFGGSLSSAQANFLSTALWRTCKVGQYEKNGFGLHDMHGNVFEWCADWYDKDYYGKSPRRDPQGPAGGVNRVFRGGSWINDGRDCRSAYRNRNPPGFRAYNVGFRVALVPSEDR